MTDFNQVVDQNPKLRKAVLDLAGVVLPYVIEELLLTGKLDKSRVNDLKYVSTVIQQNLDVVRNLRSSKRIDSEIMESAKDAAKLGRTMVVVILVATAIEHRLNKFFRDVLERRAGLSSDDATEAIRSNINTKLGWLLQLVARSGLPDPLYKRIKQIMDLRNAFVHYKSVRVKLNEKDKSQTLIEQANAIGLDNILALPDELEAELASIIENLIPEYKMASKTAKVITRAVKRKDKS